MIIWGPYLIPVRAFSATPAVPEALLGAGWCGGKWERGHGGFEVWETNIVGQRALTIADLVSISICGPPPTIRTPRSRNPFESLPFNVGRSQSHQETNFVDPLPCSTQPRRVLPCALPTPTRTPVARPLSPSRSVTARLRTIQISRPPKAQGRLTITVLPEPVTLP